jgi:hypothetical protein
MFILVAERFVCRSGMAQKLAGGGSTRIAALDLATGQRVRIQIAAAGSRSEQQAWIERCARSHAEGSLLDYGFVGKDRRFEASASQSPSTTASVLPAPRWVSEWLDRRAPSSSGLLRVPAAIDVRALRMLGFVPVLLPLLRDRSMQSTWRVLQGRSIALLDWQADRDLLALALSRHARPGREMCADGGRGTRPARRKDRPVDAALAAGRRRRAAYESRALAAYAPFSNARRWRTPAGRRQARAAERLLQRGGGIRSPRRSVSRGTRGAGLGRLLTRGRSADAADAFDRAHARFQRAQTPALAIAAMVHLGMAQTDLFVADRR